MTIVFRIPAVTIPTNKSLRFRSSAATYLNRTFGTPTNNKIWTLSLWVKRGAMTAVNEMLFSAGTSQNTQAELRFSGDFINFNDYNFAYRLNIQTTAKFRDPSAWYHIVIYVDTTQAVSTNGLRIYVNGVNTGAVPTSYTQNLNGYVNSNIAHNIGRDIGSGSFYIDDYVAELTFIDGQALDPSYFGQINTQTNQWIPKPYAGLYGNNGFYLNFSDATSVSSLGLDTSGNGNNWTLNNFSVTTGVTYDSMMDHPNNNYCTLNPFCAQLGGIPPINGNLTSSISDAGYPRIATQSLKYKSYWEVTIGSVNTSYPALGIWTIAIQNNTAGNFPNTANSGVGCGASNTGVVYSNGVNVGTFTTFTTNDVVMMAYDPVTGHFWYGKNGTWANGGNPANDTGYVCTAPSPSTNEYFPTYQANSCIVHYNFGQRPFSFTPPSGFQVLSTYNLPDPSIKLTNQHFDIVKYTGNGGTNVIATSGSSNNAYASYPVSCYPKAISNSLRFRKSANAQLSKSIAVSGNRRKWTYSVWLKRGLISPSGIFPTIFSATLNASFNDFIYFNSTTDTLLWSISNTVVLLETRKVFRTTDWMHVVLVWDTDNATPANRAKIYINGIEETSFTTDVRASYLNRDSTFNSNVTNYIGGSSNSALDFDGYMAEINFIDGQALTPDNFGQFDPTYPELWVPKQYSGAYGTNGFHLDFGDVTNLSTLGHDVSGQNNHWTCNNISLANDYTRDAMIDSPTTQLSGTRPIGNYATLNPLINPYPGTNQGTNIFSNGNLTIVPSTALYDNAVSTFAVPATGYWYAEFTLLGTAGGNNNVVGLVGYGATLTSGPGNDSSDSFGYWDLGSFRHNASVSQTVSTFGSNCTIMVALGNGKLWWGRNGVWLGSGLPNPASGTSPAYSGLTGNYYFAITDYNTTVGGNSITNWSANFGQRAFVFTPPAGFGAVCSSNMPTVDSTKWLPGLSWSKSRSGAYNHVLTDIIRGAGEQLASNSISKYTNTLQATQKFFRGGLIAGSDNTTGANAVTYVDWLWKASEKPVLNINGSVSSYVSANPTAGFSIVKWTGTFSNITIGHGLSSAPKFVIVKNTTLGAGSNWWAFHSNLTSAAYAISPNQTIAQTSSPTSWNSTAPGASTFSVGADQGNNGTGDTMIAYCFAEVPGYSKIDKYVGNGNADGPFVYCGFRPRWVMIKRIDVANDWTIFDTGRSPGNGSSNTLTPYLAADTVSGENGGGAGTAYIDLVSNGFKLRDALNWGNASGGTYIFIAFAEAPFKYANAR